MENKFTIETRGRRDKMSLTLNQGVRKKFCLNQQWFAAGKVGPCGLTHVTHNNKNKVFGFWNVSLTPPSRHSAVTNGIEDYIGGADIHCRCHSYTLDPRTQDNRFFIFGIQYFISILTETLIRVIECVFTYAPFEFICHYHLSPVTIKNRSNNS